MKKLGAAVLLMLFLLTACGEEQTTELFGVVMSQKTAEILETTQELNLDIVEQLYLIEQGETANTNLMFESIETASQNFIDHLSQLSEKANKEELVRLDGLTLNIQNLTDEVLKYQQNASDFTYEEGHMSRYDYVKIIESYLSGAINDLTHEEKLLAELTGDLEALFGTDEIIANGEFAVKTLEEDLADLFEIEFHYDGLRKHFNFTPISPSLVEYITSFINGEIEDTSFWEEHVEILTLLSEQLTEIVGSNCYIWYKNPIDSEDILLSIVDGYIFVNL